MIFKMHNRHMLILTKGTWKIFISITNSVIELKNKSTKLHWSFVVWDGFDFETAVIALEWHGGRFLIIDG